MVFLFMYTTIPGAVLTTTIILGVVILMACLPVTSTIIPGAGMGPTIILGSCLTTSILMVSQVEGVKLGVIIWIQVTPWTI